MVSDDEPTVLYRGPVPTEPAHPTSGAVTDLGLGQVWGAAGPAQAQTQPPPPVPAAGQGLFREQAVEAQRAGSNYGSPLHIVPTWMVWSVRLVALLVFTAAAFAALTRVDEHASGPAVIRIEGRRLIGSQAAGNIVAIEVKPGERVTEGQVLIRFDDSAERAKLARIEREHELLLARLLRNPSDEATRGQLASLDAERQLAQAQLTQRTVRANEGGLTSDVRVHVGQYVKPGDALLAVDGDASQVVVVGLLPGHYRPRLNADDPTLWLELEGFPQERIEVHVRAIADEVVGPQEALRFLGQDGSGSLQLHGPVVVVEARTEAAVFEAGGDTYRYYDGLQGTLEANLGSETLLESLLPDLEGLVP